MLLVGDPYQLPPTGPKSLFQLVVEKHVTHVASKLYGYDDEAADLFGLFKVVQLNSSHSFDKDPYLKSLVSRARTVDVGMRPFAAFAKDLRKKYSFDAACVKSDTGWRTEATWLTSENEARLRLVSRGPAGRREARGAVLPLEVAHFWRRRGAAHRGRARRAVRQ